MDVLFNYLPLIITVGVLLILLVVFLCCIYKVADVDKALIVTGGKDPIIKVSGGSFVIPIFRKASYFDLCMLTVKADKDELKTLTAVPIIVDWTAQIRPYIEDTEVLKKAIISFKERSSEGIISDVKLTIMGFVRSVVATLTPEQVQGDKDSFKIAIEEAVRSELKDMGLELVSLNIQDVSDNNDYFANMAAIDSEAKRLEAQKVRAITDQRIREQDAESERIAKQKELEKDLAIDAITRDNNLKKAQFKAEVDKANKDAEAAGEIQQKKNDQLIAEEEGRVNVVRKEQENLAAQAEQDVKKTQAETAKLEATIKAEEKAEVDRINAQAKADVAEKDAAGIAKAEELKAEGKAKAIEKEANANANATRAEGQAEADVIASKGKAEADSIREKLLAQAEGEKELAAARAANGQVNFEIEKIQILSEMQIQIATNTAKIMAEVGKNAEFVNISGSNPTGSGNVLLDTMNSIPGLMKTLNAQNQALNDKSFNSEVSNLVAAIAEPLKGILVDNSTTVVPVVEEVDVESVKEDTFSEVMNAPEEAEDSAEM